MTDCPMADKQTHIARCRRSVIGKDPQMSLRQCGLGVVALLLVVGPVAGQTPALNSSRASAFMGTWTFAMTNPPDSQQTVKIWDKNGIVGASLQIGKFPPNDITGILRDGNVLVLTTTVRENGAPIWAVIALTLDGPPMNMAQMLQFSQQIGLILHRQRTSS
jgi:hypothetical protein